MPRAEAIRSTCKSWRSSPGQLRARSPKSPSAAVCHPRVRVALAHEINSLTGAARQLAWGAAVVGDPVDFELAAATADLAGEPALAATRRVARRRHPAHHRRVAALWLPPSDRPPRGLRGGDRVVAAARSRACRRGVGGATERAGGARASHRALRPRRRRAQRRGARAGGAGVRHARARRLGPLAGGGAAGAPGGAAATTGAASVCSLRSRARRRPPGVWRRRWARSKRRSSACRRRCPTCKSG